MNEQVARDVVLVRAIETLDHKHEILSEDDRVYASRSARELAQWQASDSKAALTADHFLQQRAEQILKRLGERTPAFAVFLRRRPGLGILSWVLPTLALLLGAALDRIADPHRVDLLSAPLLIIIGWNVLVYLALLASMVIPRAGLASQGLLQHLSAGKAALPRKLPSPLSAALAQFMVEWTDLSAGLTRARLSRTVHVCAAMFALGAMLSLYARGMLTEYLVGWESTFLDAGGVHAILSMLFAPAAFVFNLQPFSVADIQSLRFSNTSSAVGGPRWVHLYAATLLLLVVLPRLVLAAVAHLRATRLTRKFPIDLEQPYFRKLAGQLGIAGPTSLRVFPYSFTLDEARQQGLSTLATLLYGEQARVMLRPSITYGEDARDALADADPKDAGTTVTAVLFNLAATPEKENHGAFLDHLVRTVPRGIAVLLDESSLLDRMGEHGAARVAERITLWQQFCNFHRTSATVVNLLRPDAHGLESGAGLSLSKPS
jgi:hypothetical protein